MEFHWSNKKVLFVEDDEASFIYLSELLKKNQANVVHCFSGLSAFFKCMNDPELDLVLMDMLIPELNGFDSTRLIKKFRPDIPIIAVTACAMLEDRRRCIHSGCDGYLSKPIFPKDFYSLVNFYLQPERSKRSMEFSIL